MVSLLYSLKGLRVFLWTVYIVVGVCVGGLAENAKYYMLCCLRGILLGLIMYLMLYIFVKSLCVKYLCVYDVGYNIWYRYICVWYTPPLERFKGF